MGFFGEEVSEQKIELSIPEHYSLRLVQACLAPTSSISPEVTSLFVQTVNEDREFALCSLGGSKSHPVRFCSLQHEFGPEDSPLSLSTSGGKIHLTGCWKWSTEADSECDGESEEEEEEEDVDEVKEDEEDESPVGKIIAKDDATSGSQQSKTKRKRADVSEEVVPEKKKTTRNKRGETKEVVAPASELVVVSRPPDSDTQRKFWKVKPQNNEGVSVPTPKQKTFKTGVLVTDYVVGNGSEPKLGSNVKITYEGMFPNGKVFDKNQSRKKPLKFRIGSGQVIRGLDLGMDKMRVGGSREIVIPPALGYGAAGIGDIPGNQILIFRITLIGIEKKSLSKR